MKNTKGIISYILIVFMAISLCACAEEASSINNVSYKVTEPDYVPTVGTYDSYDVAVVANVKESQSKVTFYNCELKKLYTLEFTGASRISDKYGTAMSLAQIKPGDLVEVWFLKDKKTVASMNLATNAFSEPELTNFSVNTWAKTFTIGDDSFRISDATYVVSEGKQISLEELNPSDSVTIRGIGNTIFSVVVDYGHGYLSLTGEDYFLGGFIEVGAKAIYQISSKMIMMVPEGSYSVRITNRGTEAVKDVVIKRGEETTLDLSDVKIQETKNQSFTLVVKPTTAEIFIDGKAIDKTLPVTCSYGMHKLIASADGYKTLTKYFNVDANTREISVVLLEADKEDGDVSNSDSTSTTASDSSSVSGNDSTSTSTSGSTSGSGDSTSTTTSGSNSVSGNDSTSTSTSGSGSTSTTDSTSTSTSTDESSKKTFYITIPTPKDVEVYWDGNYMGLAPLSIKKEPGTHVITLRKRGFETRSFTVTIDSVEENVSYSFDELVPKDE